MTNILIIVHAAPYGSERVLSALRIATALVDSEPALKLHLFMMSDAVGTGLANQSPAVAGGGLGEIMTELIENKVDIRLCRTCARVRGMIELPLIPGVKIGTLTELAEIILTADKVITF